MGRLATGADPLTAYAVPVTIRELAAVTRHPAVVGGIVISLLACAVNIAGTFLEVGWMQEARWLYVPPLVMALIAAGGLRDVRGRWWAAGLVLSWVGDTQGGRGFLILLGAFLIAHVCYVVALWPTRGQSLLGRRAAVPYLLLGLAGVLVLAPAAGLALAAPVTAYAALLTLMAVLAAAAGRVGVLGGLLFMLSDLVLGLGIFAVDLPDGLQTLVVIGTYVPAQVLLLLGTLLLIRTRVGLSSASHRQRVD